LPTSGCRRRSKRDRRRSRPGSLERLWRRWLPHHRQRRAQGCEDLDRRERSDLLPGQVRMVTLAKGQRPQTDEHGNQPQLAHWIRWLSVPQIEVVGQAWGVQLQRLGPDRAGRRSAARRCGPPVRPLDRQEAQRRHQAMRARSGFLERSTDGRLLAEFRRSVGRCAGVTCGHHRRGPGQRVGGGRHAIDSRLRPAVVIGGQRLGRPVAPVGCRRPQTGGVWASTAPSRTR
jgi:hypothetical protein